MDYPFCSTLRYNSVMDLNVFYDITCQWSKHLFKHLDTRLNLLPCPLLERNLAFFILKFHLPTHIEKCQTAFSFNFIPGVGHTDGEAPERSWVNINLVASSTKEMGPGGRRNVLDNHFGHLIGKR